MTERPPRVLKLLNVVMFAAVVVANAAAGAGALSGESIGVVANRYPNYFLPANLKRNDRRCPRSTGP